MNSRDKAILKDLERFRCMSRDDLVDIHFSHTKNPVTGANVVLKRLRRDGHIEANINLQPYVYFPSGNAMKRNSQKIPHFLAIVAVYRELRRQGALKTFEVESKYGKGYMEPDIFAVINYRGVPTPLFLEVQNSLYTKKTMQEKIDRYESYFRSGEWKEKWKSFPNIVLLTETQYDVHSDLFPVWQYKCVTEFLKENIKTVEKSKLPVRGEVSAQIGSRVYRA